MIPPPELFEPALHGTTDDPQVDSRAACDTERELQRVDQSGAISCQHDRESVYVSQKHIYRYVSDLVLW